MSPPTDPPLDPSAVEVRGRSPLIGSVADTALWTASLRAIEGGRRDAAFIDPFADLLAGAAGRKIARAMSPSAVVGWGVVVRTSAIDRLLEEAVQAGVDLILDLGAGMDTRPYRLQLPSSLRWVEVDLPAVVAVKNERLRHHRPACRVERIAMNLLAREDRRRLFADLAGQCRKALVIAEGMIPYFSNADAAGLALDIHGHPAFGEWILDYDNAGMRQTPAGWKRKLKAAPFRFSVVDWFRFFGEFGWKTRKAITSAEESTRLNRPFPWVFPQGFLLRALPAAVSHRVLCASGAVSLERT